MFVMYLEPATQEQLDKIYAKWDTSEKILEEGAKYLIEWMNKQPHLPNITDVDFIKRILLRNRSSTERTKRHLDKYYTLRAQMDIFAKRDVHSDHVQKTMRLVNYIVMPKLTPEGNRIWIWRLSDLIKDVQVTADAVFEAATITLDVQLKADKSGPAILIFDLKNLSVPVAASLFAAMKRMITYAWKMALIPFIKVYTLNVTPTVEMLVNFTHGLLSKKLVDRVEIWKKDQSRLCEVLPKEVLPSDYGGDLQSLDELTEMSIKFFEAYRHWIIEQRDIKADLSKRPQTDTNVDSMYGMEGYFKKIDVD